MFATIYHLFSGFTAKSIGWLGIVIMGLPLKLPAQTFVNNEGYGVEVNVINGKILKHTPKIKADVPRHSYGLDVNLSRKLLGEKDWHQRRGFPTVGLGITYLQYNGAFKNAVGLQPNLEIPIISAGKLTWLVRMGFGLAWAFQPYERAPKFDTLNNAIGSRINNFSLFETHLRYQLAPKWEIQLGANFSHISNAALRLPNYGINMYGLHLGLRFSPNGNSPKVVVHEREELPGRWLVNARLGMAWNEYAAPDGPMYKTFLGAIYASKRWRSHNKIIMGVDASYHQLVNSFQKNNGINPGEEKSKSWSSALFVGNEFLYGRTGIWLQVGGYWRRNYLVGAKMYQKLGLNYYFLQSEKGTLKEGAIGIFLKTHTANAELAEVALSVGL